MCNLGMAVQLRGVEIGRAEGRAEGLLSGIKNLMKTMKFTLQQVDALEISETVQDRYDKTIQT